VSEVKTYLSADDFLNGITGRAEDYAAPGIGLVRLRALTVEEVRDLRKRSKGDELLLMAYAVQTALVEPQLSANDVDRLLAGGAGFVDKIANRILEISGMKEREELENLAGAGS